MNQECNSYKKQDFLVCTTIYKAQRLASFNADTYVQVSIGKRSKQTRVFQNSENPFYNEFFTFHFFCTLSHLLHYRILYQVKQVHCLRDIIVGELSIDLNTLWNQPTHGFFKKWGKIENPIGKPADILRGHLQIDVSIMSHNDQPQPAILENQNYDDIEKNLLKADSLSKNIQNVKYHIKIYHGYFLKKNDYLMQISFAGMNMKTKVRKSTNFLQWNIEFSVNWFYPSLSQTLLIEIMTNEFLHWKTVGNCEIYFSDIGFPDVTPSLGPTYLHLYDSSNPNNYIGRILIEIKSVLFNKEIAVRTITQSLIAPLLETVWWTQGDFIIEFLFWHGDFIHSSSNNIKIFMKCAEITSNKIECVLKHYENKKNLKYFIQERPFQSIQMKLNFPDYRLKYEIDYFIKDFIKFMEDQIKHFENYKNDVLNCRNCNDIANIEKTYKDYLTKITEFEYLLSSKIQDSWPDLILTVTIYSKEVAFCKLNIKNFLYCNRRECLGQLCGIKQQFIFKPLSCKHSCKNCGCIFGKIDGLLWIGTETEHNNYKFLKTFEVTEQFHYNIAINTYVNCNIYIHQGKIRPGADQTGLSDPKVCITFFDQSIFSTTIKQTLSPIWNEIIKFENFQLPGSYDWYIKNPPLVGVEVFDEDSATVNEYIGFNFIQASVKFDTLKHIFDEQYDSKILNKLKKIKHIFPPLLRWLTIYWNGEITAELLISCELIEIERVTDDLIKQVKIEQDIPQRISPIMKKYKIEVVFAGLRNFSKTLCETTTGKYKIKIQCGNFSLQSGPSGSRLNDSINFLDLYSAGIVDLPQQLEYWPPIMLTHIVNKNSKYNSELTMGSALITDATKYLLKEKAKCDDEDLSSDNTMINLGTETDFTNERTPLINDKNKKHNLRLFVKKVWNSIPKKISLGKSSSINTIDRSDYNWWTKFYYSLYKGSQRFNDIVKRHELIIYRTELEKQSEFSYLQDWAEPIHLVQKVHKNPNTIPKDESYCTLKFKITIRSCDALLLSAQESSSSIKSNKNEFNTKFQQLTTIMSEIPIIVRVYIVQGLHLRSHDARSASDAFIKIKLGEKKMSDRANFVPNNSNPIFGKRFQLQAIIPREHILYISIYDRGTYDSLIGTTTIDLEDRLRSKHRATVGIAKEYSSSGYNIWHDIYTPSHILKQICKKHNLDPPTIYRNMIQINGITFFDSTELSKDEDLEERLSLTVLNNIEKIPKVGYKLVPEHVETRSLYRKDYPGIEQGKIQMWVEIYETDSFPFPIEITPNPMQLYELRVIIYNTADVIMDERNIFATKMTDIFVKGFEAIAIN